MVDGCSPFQEAFYLEHSGHDANILKVAVPGRTLRVQLFATQPCRRKPQRGSPGPFTEVTL